MPKRLPLWLCLVSGASFLISLLLAGSMLEESLFQFSGDSFSFNLAFDTDHKGLWVAAGALFLLSLICLVVAWWVARRES